MLIQALIVLIFYVFPTFYVWRWTGIAYSVGGIEHESRIGKELYFFTFVPIINLIYLFYAMCNNPRVDYNSEKIIIKHFKIKR